jgi:predicted ATPase
VHDDTPQAKLDKIDAVLTQTSTQEAALFAEMLSLPNDGRYPALDLTPEQRRQRALEALVSQMEALARKNPVLMIFEDAHWTDPTTLELFGRIVDRVRSLRVLLIVTFRPDFDPPWVGRPYVTFLAINRLGEREILAMIEGVIGNKPLPANIRQEIIERTDGIPLFVEEMTKAVLEAESQGGVEHLTATVPSSALAVPASLQASLMARLDRLGPAKEVAQIGAAIGRKFSHALLAVVVRKPEADLASALDRLIVAGLLFRQGVPPHASYLFKHALVQDVAYDTLLREPTRALHARIAEALESQFPKIAESQPDPGFSALCQRVRALWLLGYPDAALRDAEHALTIGRGTDHAGTLMTALFHSAVLHLLVGNYIASAAQAQELAALAEKKGALSWKVAGTSWQGVVYALTGKASSAVQILTSGITELRSMGTTISIPQRLSDLARAHAELGQYDAAWRCINEAMTLTETSNERWFEADLHRIAGDLTLMSPEPDAAKAEAYFERTLAVARQQQAKSWELRAAMSMARLWRDQGKRDEARDLLAPVYGWFTEGFDTLDLKEAKALLDDLAA